MDEKKVIRISVRNLVEFLLRSGDIDRRTGGFTDRDAMQAGTRQHQKIQKKMGSAYQAEVPLLFEREYDHFVLKIEGRADGILTDEEGVLIDEIKGTYRELEKMEEPVMVHLAQAKCYAYIYGSQNQLTQIGILMTYCLLESDEERFRQPLTKEEVLPSSSNWRIRHFRMQYQIEELTQWFEGLLEQYYQWAEFQFQWQKKRDESMQGLEFPFPYRSGQRDLVTSVYRTILRKKELFVQAPTGVGKTMSTVFPAIRAIGEGYGERLFYLTAKTITRTVAEEAISILKSKGLFFKAITLTAREKMCVLEEPECDPIHCPRARGHYDRINDAVFEILTEGSEYDREAILDHAEKWQVCPHELQFDIASWVDGIICDYNYAFDPTAKLKRFFGEGTKGDYIFLIDEAHNLVDRGREMFSASLVKEDIMEIRRALRPYSPGKKLEKALNRCNHQMLVYKRECENCTELESVSSFVLMLNSLLEELEKYMESHTGSQIGKQLLDFYFQLQNFVSIYELLDENYLIYTSYLENGDFVLRLFCVNPASNLQKCINQGRAAVFFSATLLPIQYYKKMFSTNKDDYAIYIDSPFAKENRTLLIGREVSTKYTRRNLDEYDKIAFYIYAVTSARKGNYMVFFPSYRLLQDVYGVFEKKYQTEDMRCLLQETAMKEREREAFLLSFAEENDHTLVGFCIMGGIFSEGIDLDGEKLIGAIVVGTGIPQVGPERELLKQYYDRHEENGFDYAYRYPGMNKVLQAAGRVIRTTTDRGVILLLDQRFLNAEYRQLFPREWSDYRISSRETVKEEIGEFWRYQDSRS
ncbi:MAG: helicase C-terminal domain-containing protein [Fusicatenibacter sp.]